MSKSDKPEQLDPTTELFHKPHTISLLVAVICGLIYVAFFVQFDSTNNIKVGLLTACGTFLIICITQFRDGPFIRPHPAFWRMMLGLSVLYQLLLTFMLFQTKSQMREYVAYLDPNLGVPLPEKSYAENCSMDPMNVWSQLDEYVIAHAFGWFGKALVLRDYWFMWILSVLFELAEYTYQHQLPNFAECWWDHWILDVLIANWIGLTAGMKCVAYFEMRTYHWRGYKQIKSYSGKVNRSIQQFTPRKLDKFTWATTSSLKNYVAVVALLWLILQCELNDFYLKYLLWIPGSHWINISRLVLFFGMCLPACRELYQYLTDKECKKFGSHAWMVIVNILTEMLVVQKISVGEFNERMPTLIVIGWCMFGVALVCHATWLFFLREKIYGKQVDSRQSSPIKGEILMESIIDSPTKTVRIAASVTPVIARTLRTRNARDK